jgi:HD-like signal output (HDOD) protein
MPDALLQLELCLSAPVVDLQDIINIIKSDLGLTVQLLRLAAHETEPASDRMSAIREIVIQVGIDKLKALVVQTQPLPKHLIGHAKLGGCERLWMHSRLAAVIAEELAVESSEVVPDEAYLAGLLCHVGELPAMLGWATSDSCPADFRHTGYRMAKAWELPGILADVIGDYGKFSHNRESRALLEVAEAADNWASRLEFLAAREAMRSE